jgi:hypothetical protein
VKYRFFIWLWVVLISCFVASVLDAFSRWALNLP